VRYRKNGISLCLPAGYVCSDFSNSLSSKHFSMMRRMTFFKQAAIVASLLSFQPACKIFQRSDLSKQAKEIRHQLPDMNAEEGKEGLEVYFKPTILFAFDKAEIPQQIKSNLNKFADILKRYPDYRILVRGHTDDLGTEAYNQSLSEQRAETVKEYLVTQGVNASRLKVRGYGNTVARYSNDSEAGRAKNRRVEFLILGK
jgi:outer membrane protein OmpA-like peptidoglycan-associated protein